MSTVSTAPPLVQFFDPVIKAPDHANRTLDQILSWPNSRLERCHDYIQIIFPLPEDSMFSWSAAIVDEPTFLAFRSRPDLRQRLLQTFARMAAFYGFRATWIDGSEDVSISPLEEEKDSLDRLRNWVVPVDHNHLRITRVIRSLRVLGLEQPARAFHSAILEVNAKYPGRISARSLSYWHRAATRGLHLAPHEEEGAEGRGFLRVWVERQRLELQEQASKKSYSAGEGKGETNLEVEAGAEAEAEAEAEKGTDTETETKSKK